MSIILTPDNVVEYYTTVKDYNVYAVIQIVQNDPVALAAYEAFLVARTAAAISNPATS
jgi:hypothetical protein